MREEGMINGKRNGRRVRTPREEGGKVKKKGERE